MPRISHEKALSKIEQYLRQLNELQTMSYREGGRLREEMNISIRGFLPLAFDDGKEKAKEFDGYVNWFIAVAGYEEPPSKKQEDYEQRLRNMKTFITRWKEELEMTQDITSTKKNNVEINSSEIFIVHGHDEKATLELENLLRRLELKPIILHRQPDKGRTIIEKFEGESKSSGYAFVLLTPDDDCMVLDEETNHRNKVDRPRQNVVLELGFFIGSLGRERVCAIYKKGVDIPSDMEGVLYKPYTKTVEELYQDIRKELTAAGYQLPSY